MYPKPYFLTELYLQPAYKLWYTSLVCTTKIDFPIPNDQSFHGSSTMNFGIGKTKLGNANIDFRIYPDPHGIWNLFLIVQKAIIFLRDSKIQPSTFTKPRVAIRLNYEFRLSFLSQRNILEAANTSAAYEFIYFLHSWGLQLNKFKHLCQESTNCWTIMDSGHLNGWVLLTTCHHEAIILVFPWYIPTFSTK